MEDNRARFARERLSHNRKSQRMRDCTVASELMIKHRLQYNKTMFSKAAPLKALLPGTGAVSRAAPPAISTSESRRMEILEQSQMSTKRSRQASQTETNGGSSSKPIKSVVPVKSKPLLKKEPGEIADGASSSEGEGVVAKPKIAAHPPPLDPKVPPPSSFFKTKKTKPLKPPLPPSSLAPPSAPSLKRKGSDIKAEPDRVAPAMRSTSGSLPHGPPPPAPSLPLVTALPKTLKPKKTTSSLFVPKKKKI